MFNVYLGACSIYDSQQIADVIQTGLDAIQFNQSISGHVVIKPNLVMAHPAVATEGYTRPAVVDALLGLLRRDHPQIRKLDIVEKSGLGITTSAMFKTAGYHKLKQKHGVRLRAMEAIAKVNVPLHNAQVHDTVTVAREMAERDVLIFMPKLKSNVLSHGLSGALKLNIGTLDGRERLHRHHYDLPHKIADMLEIANPDLIVTDGIRMAYGGNQMTQHGTHLGVIVMADNAVAHDLVCARLLNLNPAGIEHIQEAARRGYGPATLNEVRIVGDYPVKKAQSITAGLDLGFRPVDQVESPMTVHSGAPYCTAGCHGIFLDWIYMIKDRKPKLFAKLPALNVIVGKVEKDLQSGRFVLIGDCAKTSRLPVRGRKVWIRGCPPSHKRIVWDMMVHYLIFNPLVRPSLIVDAYIRYPLNKLKSFWLNAIWYRHIRNTGTRYAHHKTAELDQSGNR
ncbi:MAG: DUF362 domain-containing protein [candidate division KSB1 bacterium]|nr:DUF362 domain-containing protein [candidate division KSB1 bacterium]